LNQKQRMHTSRKRVSPDQSRQIGTKIAHVQKQIAHIHTRTRDGKYVIISEKSCIYWFYDVNVLGH